MVANTDRHDTLSNMGYQQHTKNRFNMPITIWAYLIPGHVKCMSMFHAMKSLETLSFNYETPAISLFCNNVDTLLEL